MEFCVDLHGYPYAQMRDLVREAEDRGYGAVFIPDHFIYGETTGGYDADACVHEVLTMMAALGEATSTIKLGMHVLCTLFRHPTITAKMLTTIDHISEGRLIAGFGAGWTKTEFDMMGYEFPDVTTRLRIMEETVDVVRALWTEDRANYEGEFFTLADAVASPKPVQTPHPPILLGGNGNGILRRAGRFGDIVNIVVGLGKHGKLELSEVGKLTSDAFKRKIGVVREEEEKAGRSAGTVQTSTTIFQFAVTDSPETTNAYLDNMGGIYQVDPAILRHMPLVLIGTKGEIADELAWREQEWGLDQLILSAGGPDEMRAFADTVLT